MNTEALNKLQSLIISFANENNISLKAEFGSVENFKTFVFALAVKSLVDAGIAVNLAFDFIVGHGEYEALANRVWEINN